jgi:hypothetical protein
MLQPVTRVSWTTGDLFGRNVGVNICPACGTVPAGRSSRYCAKHLRHLRDAWQAHLSEGAAQMPSFGAPAR